uniref:Uncharacterized protein n=1 Tax=Caenorhabditis japonica TaxID=281687 RepID=A0A8R1EV69_CAEJA
INKWRMRMNIEQENSRKNGG